MGPDAQVQCTWEITYDMKCHELLGIDSPARLQLVY